MSCLDYIDLLKEPVVNPAETADLCARNRAYKIDAQNFWIKLQRHSDLVG